MARPTWTTDISGLTRSKAASLLGMRIALASDHAGFRYKELIKQTLNDWGHITVDFGTHNSDPCDYPRFVRPAAEAVARGECECGVVLGGSGNGEAICANKVRGIRAAVCWSHETARAARAHNDANILALGERMISETMAIEILKIFLETDFEGGRHDRRIRMLEP